MPKCQNLETYKKQEKQQQLEKVKISSMPKYSNCQSTKFAKSYKLSTTQNGQHVNIAEISKNVKI